MKVLAIRFCSVSAEAEGLADFFANGLGLPQLDMGDDGTEFNGAIFPAGESWVEIWKQGPQMPAGVMLQIVVDDADAVAEAAKANGVEVSGPIDAHGERIYYSTAPGGLSVSFQSQLT
jgi:predicted enzyme related to lactoylglutathione lyase